MYIYTHINTHIHAHTHAHTCTRICIHTQTFTHTPTLPPLLFSRLPPPPPLSPPPSLACSIALGPPSPPPPPSPALPPSHQSCLPLALHQSAKELSSPSSKSEFRVSWKLTPATLLSECNRAQYNMLQHAATHCNTLLHPAMHLATVAMSS